MATLAEGLTAAFALWEFEKGRWTFKKMQPPAWACFDMAENGVVSPLLFFTFSYKTNGKLNVSGASLHHCAHDSRTAYANYDREEAVYSSL